MDAFTDYTLRTVENTPVPCRPGLYVPATISDVLYLIAAQHADALTPRNEQRLSHANICFIRGDLPAALTSVSAVLDDQALSPEVYDSIVALRIFLVSMIEQNYTLRHSGTPGGEFSETCPSGASKVVSLCVESNEHWHSGSLFKGLLANRSALAHSHDVTPIWRVYADLLLAKKLTDIHVTHQASRVLVEMRGLIDNSGLQAFEPVLDSLRSVVHLQSGQFASALESATSATRLAEQRATTVGCKLALSVTAMAQLGLGAPDEAAAALKSFHAQPTSYVLPDSVARAAFAELALTASDEGPRAAAERIRVNWPLLYTSSACFIEDVTRPAWLVAVARRAGDTDLAARAFGAIRQLAGNNPAISPLSTAAEYARAAFDGERGWPRSALDLGESQDLPGVAPAPAVTAGPVPPAGPGESAPAVSADPTGPADPADPTGPADPADPAGPVGTGATSAGDGAGTGLAAVRPVAGAAVPRARPAGRDRDAALEGGRRQERRRAPRQAGAQDRGQQWQIDPPRPGLRPAGGQDTADPVGAGPARLPSLSLREAEIARLVGRGLTNRQVASTLGVSPHTVNFHLRGIFRKLSISTRVQLGRIVAQLDGGLDLAVSPERRG